VRRIRQQHKTGRRAPARKTPSRTVDIVDKAAACLLTQWRGLSSMRSGRIATRTHMVLVARANAPVRWQPARVFGGALFRRSSGADTPPFIINQLKLSVYHETGEVAVRSGILRNILVECNVFGHLGARRKVGLFMLSSCSSLAMLQSSSSSCACSCSATCTPINSGGSHHSMVSGIERSIQPSKLSIRAHTLVQVILSR
jgi:hypothetical protein